MEKLKVINGEIYEKAELNGCKLLNSNKVNHPWKRDFKKEHNTDDWDILNSCGIKIEIKSNRAKKEFGANRCSLNTKNQHNYMIMKLFIDDYGNIKDYKFVRKNNDCWVNITNKILCKNKRKID